MRTLKIVTIVIIFCLALSGIDCGLFDCRCGSINWTQIKNSRVETSDHTMDVYGIIVGDSGAVATSDGIATNNWIDRQSGVTQNLYGLCIRKTTDSSIAYTVGEQGVILRSSNKGHSWQTINPPNPGFPNFNTVDILSITSPGITNVIAAGNNGKVVMTTTSGNNWVLLDRSVSTTKKLNSVAVSFEHLYVVVGDSGAIFRTLDGGANWQNRSISAGISLKKVVSTRYDSYCAVGSNGTIYTSIDYGFTWTPRVSNTVSTLNDVVFSSVDSGIVVGDNKVVRVTTNGGVSWQPSSAIDSLLGGLPQRDIKSITQVDEITVNTISKRSITESTSTTDSTFIITVSSNPFLGIEPISNLITKVFGLKQNYPNPFNPVTNIRFDIPAGSKTGYFGVKIIIHDVTGKKIDEILNEHIKAGQYEVSWDGSNYPSGVYFYTVIAGEFSLTRKMVLVK